MSAPHRGSRGDPRAAASAMASLPPRAGPATPLSPARLSRLQEKEELRELNDRLAHYIDRVRALELENDRLLLRISEKEEVTTREVSGIKALYESELADARRVLDETARERARLQIEMGKLQAELDEARKSAKKREGELTVAQGRVKDLESLFHRSEAELASALSDKHGLETDVAELRAQLAKAEDGHAVAKKQLEKETLMRVDLENRCQSLQEELGFSKSVFEEEVRETRRRHERRLVEVDSSRQQEYDFKMAQALEELRSQHDEQVRLYRLELEQTYQAKVRPWRRGRGALFSATCVHTPQLLQLDNAKLSSDQNDKAASAAREELKEARMRMLEEAVAGERDKFRKMLDAKEQEMTEVRNAMQQQLAEYQELLDIKLALDMEISAYRKLLEGEEERLKLSPSPSSRSSSSSSGVGMSVGRGRGKRRRLETEDTQGSRSSASGSAQQAAVTGVVSIDEVDLEGRFVRLKNSSDKDQSLGNWRIKRQVLEGEEIAYKFTPKYVLRAGQTVTVWAAGAGVAHSPPSTLVWKGQSSWGSGESSRTVLVSADGEEVAVQAMEQASVQVSENGEEEEEEAEFGEEDLFHQQGDPRTTSRGCRLM
ncbi:Lmnb2 [Lemmus lemmus]